MTRIHRTTLDNMISTGFVLDDGWTHPAESATDGVFVEEWIACDAEADAFQGDGSIPNRPADFTSARSGARDVLATNNINWLDIIPAIPLTENVPLIHPEYHDTRLVTIEAEDSSTGWVRCVQPRDGQMNNWRTDALRIDLSSPQGFAYGLRHWSINDTSGNDWPAWALRAWSDLMRDCLDETDMVNLARALADLVY